MMGIWNRWFKKSETAMPSYREFEREMFERKSRLHSEAFERAKEQGFQLLLDPMTMRYVDGFNRDTETEFMRYGWLAPAVFKLADMSPFFNVWGLYWRPFTALEQRSQGYSGRPEGGEE